MRVKKLLALILCAAMAASLLSGLSLTATAASYYTRTELEKVIADTAIAYYLKGPDCQYDSFWISGLSRSKTGISRLTFGMSPEECSPQRRFYTVCSSFPHEVYYNVFENPSLRHILNGEDMLDTEMPYYNNLAAYTGLNPERLTDDDLIYAKSLVSITANYGAYGKKIANNEDGWVGHDGIVYFWGSNHYEDITDAQLTEIKNNLRPGDIISVVKGDEEADDGESGGHTMIFLGDYKGDGKKYIIHSGGAKYNNDDTTFTYTDTESGITYPGKPYTANNNNGSIRPGYWTIDSSDTSSYVVGFDRVENSSEYSRNGTIVLNPFDNTLGRGKVYGPGSSGESVIKQFVVMRPIDRLIGWNGTAAEVRDDDQFPKDGLTHSAYARKQYPGLEITTLADKTTYNDVQPGETLTYRFKIENDTSLTALRPRYDADANTAGTTYPGMTLTAEIPENVDFNVADCYIENTSSNPANGTTSYDPATRTLTVDKFQVSRGLSFTVNVPVTVSADAKPGDTIVLPKARLTGSKTGEYFELGSLTHVVGGAHPDGFGGITAGSVVNSGARTKMDVADDVYAAAGYQLDLPDTTTFLNSVLTYTYSPRETSRRMQSRLLDPDEITDPDALLLRKMIVPHYIGGRKLFTPNAAGVRTNENRLLDFNEEFLQPGDILVYAYTGTTTESSGRAIANAADAEKVYVYLGNSDYAYYDDDGVFRTIHAPLQAYKVKGKTITVDRNGNTPASAARFEYSAVLTQAFRYSYFFCLRPSLAYTSLPSMQPSASAAYTVRSAGGVTTGCSTLASALAVANMSAGSTLTLHEDAALTANQVFYGGTLNLNGHTLTTGANSLLLGSGSSVQTLKNGTVTGTGDAVFCADSSATTIENMKIFGGSAGAALAASDSASVTLDGVELAAANTTALPVRTASGTQTNLTFQNDVTVLAPAGCAGYADYDGNGASLGAGVARYAAACDAYYQISDAAELSAYRAVTFTKDPTAYNETKNISYASLSDAIQNAAANDTIILRRDVRTANLREIGAGDRGRVGNTASTRTYAANLGKNLTIDFAGHTLANDDEELGGSSLFIISGSNVVITMKNGTIHTLLGWAVNLLAKELHLDNMKVYAKAASLVLSDSNHVAHTVYAENGTLIVGGLGGYSSATSNNAIELRHGNIVLRGGSRIGSLTGIAIRTGYLTGGSSTKPTANTSNVTVEDGGLFTGRYAYQPSAEENGYYTCGVDETKNVASLTFLADSDPVNYTRETFREETVEIPGSKAIIAVDRTIVTPGAVSNVTTGVQYDTLTDALTAAEAGQTLVLNGAYTLTENAALPEGVTLNLGAYTLTVPAGVTLDAQSGVMSAGETGRLMAAGTVRCGESPANRIPDGQVRMEPGAVYGDITAPAGAEYEGKTMIPGTDMDKALSLNLNDMIVINHYLADSEGVYTNDSFAFVDGGKTAMTKEGTNWYLPVRESVAKEMGRESVVQPIGVDGEGAYHIGRPNTLSIRGYAEQLLAETDWNGSGSAKLGRTMIAMLNYGAAAQSFFGYETEDLANKNLTAADQARMTVYVPETLTQYRVNNRTTNDTQGLYYASSCVLGSSQALCFYLNLPESRADRDALTFRVSYRNYNGVSRTITKSFAELKESDVNGIYSFEVPRMAAADVKTDVTLTVEKADAAIATVTDSIANYCARVHDSAPAAADLADALLIYGLSARDYFYNPDIQPEPADNELPMN